MIASVSAVKEITEMNKLSYKDTNNQKKSVFSESHKEKLRQKSLKRTRDAN